MVKKKVEVEKEVQLVASGVLRLISENGGSLELITWHDEPAVIIDGKTILRRSTLVQQLARAGQPILVVPDDVPKEQIEEFTRKWRESQDRDKAQIQALGEVNTIVEEAIAKGKQMSVVPLAMSEAVTRLSVYDHTHVTIDGKEQECLYLSMIVRDDDLAYRELRFGGLLDTLIEYGYVTARLSPPVRIRLADNGSGNDRNLFTAYLFCTKSRDEMNQLMGGEFFTEEGDLGPEAWPVLEESRPDLNTKERADGQG